MTDIAGDTPSSNVTPLRVTLQHFLRGKYARGFFHRIASQALAVIILIEAIFLAEHFTWVFRDAVRHEADLSGIALVLACTSTEIFDLALAVAILMASYMTLLRMRENREILVLFASGLGPYQLGVLVLIVALAGQVTSTIGSGLLDPLSRYAQRSILFSSELRSLKKGVAKNEFYYFPSYVAYAMERVEGGAPPPAAPGQVPTIDASGGARPAAPAKDRTLFVYQQIGPNTSRIVTSAQARLDGPDRSGRIVLNMSDFTSHTFADAHPLGGTAGTVKCTNCPDTLKDSPPISMKVRDMSQLMMVDQLLPFTARSSNTVEQTLFEQLFVPDYHSPDARAAQMRLLAERFSRSLLSFLAPLVALLGVALTNRTTNWFALPLACLGLMAVNLLCEWVITSVAPVSVAGALLPVLILYGGVAYGAFTLIVWRHAEFVRPQFGALMSAPTRPGARPIYLAPFGLYSRYMLAAYLRHTVMVSAALMTVALAIDLLPQVALFNGGPLQVVFSLAQLTVLRLPDLLPPFVPFAAFLGVVWSESAFTESRERLLIWNSGRSPLFCLVPALFAGLLIGAFLFGLDVFARPAAIHAQMDERLGREGIRLDRSQSGGMHWIALPDGLLRAEIEYGPPLKLHDATIYRLDSEGHLAEVDTAAVAQPMGNDLWRLTSGRYWRADSTDRGDVLSTGGTPREKETPFENRTIAMSLNDLWLRNLGLSPQYLYLKDLRILAHAQIMSQDLSGYRTRLQIDFGEAVFTVLMALMGAALSLHYFAYATRWFALVAVLLTGYLAHFASKAFILMGEFGYIAPFWAGWLAPLLLLAGVARVLMVLQKKRGLGVRLEDTPHYADAAAEEGATSG